jgi:predicted signal transduction protein with EAL and GGDEF domain
VGERLVGCLRGGDTAARLGGDEFALLLEDVERPEEAGRVAQRVIDALRPPFDLEGKKAFVYASIGIAMSIPGDLSPHDLLRNADLAMYIAKRRGKGGYEYFQPAMHQAVVRRLELKAELEQALERDEFVLHYQPFVDLESGRITAVEALVRWLHPEHGLVPPLDFIPLAEETGLIVRIGSWVLHEACRQARVWQREHPAEPPLAMGVNLSGRQLQTHEIVEDVRSALTSSALHPSSLILEITESVLLHEADGVTRTLAELKELGVQLAIDDFGTGYSSLGYIDRFPVDVVKIAKPFIDGVASGPDGSAMAKAMITLGSTLGLRTVAEGIEDAAQLAELRALACDQGQGFYLARPLPAAELGGLLAHGALPAEPARRAP